MHPTISQNLRHFWAIALLAVLPLASQAESNLPVPNSVKKIWSDLETQQRATLNLNTFTNETAQPAELAVLKNPIALPWETETSPELLASEIKLDKPATVATTEETAESKTPTKTTEKS